MTTVGEMTVEEFRELVESVIEEKLRELLGDPDEGLLLRQSIRERLLRRRQAVAEGERGVPMESVLQKLGLAE